MSKDESPTNVARNIALIGGGIIAWIFAYWRSSIAEQRVNQARLEHIHTRFENASELLARSGIENSLARISAFRAFRFLVSDEPELGPQIVATVTSYMIQTPLDEGHDVKEFIYAAEAAKFTHDTMEQSGLFSEKEIFHVSEDVRLAIHLVNEKIGDTYIKTDDLL